jgi:tRNA pseudouridine38-40 synthase
MKSVKIINQNDKISIEFRSQSFLQQQVRSMVGCLKYLGEEKWSLKKFDRIIKLKKRENCAPPAPAKGLFLSRVFY